MPTTKTQPTLPRLAALKAEAVATATNQPVPEALCEVCGRPSQSWMVEQYALATQDLNNEIAKRGKENRELAADKATLTTENEKLRRENLWLTNQLDKNTYIATPDGDLPLWLPAAICFVFALIGVAAAHYIMGLIAVLLGLGGAV